MSADAVLTVFAAGDHEALRLLLHPYLHWTDATGVTIRGRKNVLALLEAVDECRRRARSSCATTRSGLTQKIARPAAPNFQCGGALLVLRQAGVKQRTPSSQRALTRRN
jgi:hypothetical protein